MYYQHVRKIDSAEGNNTCAQVEKGKRTRGFNSRHEGTRNRPGEEGDSQPGVREKDAARYEAAR